MTEPLDLELLAARITSRLFTNGFKEQASRLVLTSAAGNDLGGWAYGPAKDQVFDVLRAALGRVPSTARPHPPCYELWPHAPACWCDDCRESKFLEPLAAGRVHTTAEPKWPDLTAAVLVPATAEKDYRRCGYCHVWASRPCGEQCSWSPYGETVEQARLAAGRVPSTEPDKEP